MNNKLIVVTGGAGYLGSVLVPMLLKANFRVRVVDRFFFGTETLDVVKGHCELIEADTRWCLESVFAGAYAVIDLAALANDPLCELDPERTLEINFRARIRTATLAKKHGARRYILASSCSVYGFQDDFVDESATPAPLSAYATSCMLAEQGVFALGDDQFAVTALRQGTLYGLSPRMRFDLVINTMTLALNRDRVIKVCGGEQWRPLLHVADSASGFLLALQAPQETVAGEIFNIAGHNLTVDNIAQQVQAASGEGKIINDTVAVDNRSYRVHTDKIRQTLGFTPIRTLEKGTREVLKALQEETLIPNPKNYTLGWYKQLLLNDSDILDRPFTSATSK